MTTTFEHEMPSTHNKPHTYEKCWLEHAFSMTLYTKERVERSKPRDGQFWSLSSQWNDLINVTE